MFARVAKLAIVALVLVIAGQAGAAPLSYGTYYDETTFYSCSSGISCRVNFSQTPADKLLMVNKISCNSTSSAQLVQGTLHIATTFGGGDLPTRSLPLVIPTTSVLANNSAYYVSFREDAHYLIGQGRFPFLLLESPVSGTKFGRCTLIGDLVTPIQ